MGQAPGTRGRRIPDLTLEDGGGKAKRIPGPFQEWQHLRWHLGGANIVSSALRAILNILNPL